ncbi:MAG: NUDIX hydrolase [Candidatus Nitrosocaldaceae archaeon]
MKKRVYEGKILNLRVDNVEINGRESIREVVEHNGSVAILPIIDDSFLMERQYRYAIDKTLLEIPAGTLEEGEEPYDCAKRELREETGYVADTLIYLGSMYLTPGYCTELMHFFIAKDLRFESEKLDFDEVISVECIKIDNAIDMAMKGEINDLKTVYAILRYTMQYH